MKLRTEISWIVIRWTMGTDRSQVRQQRTNRASVYAVTISHYVQGIKHLQKQGTRLMNRTDYRTPF